MRRVKKGRFFCFTMSTTQLVVFVCIVAVIALSISALAYNQTTSVDATGNPAKLAIIIDDFGRQRKGVKNMLELDCKLTVAVMPFLEHSTEDAQEAVNNKKEVIIHLPMQATTHDNPNHIGINPITIDQTPTQVKELMDKILEDIPQAVGANIHMGTLCSTKKETMRPVFEKLKEKNMYFVDSMTSSKSICDETAMEIGIPFYSNRVFLEHEQKTKAYVKKRLAKAMKIAKDKGQCIAIGHVGVEGGNITVEAIREMMDDFKANDVELVYVSELIPKMP